MKIGRTKNATRNIVFDVLLKIYQILIPFVMRTIMIYFLGIQYLGLNSLFTSILQVLNLAELGVGSAMVYSMYKPIVDDDKQRLCALMRLYRTYYHVIGLVIAIAGGILTPFVPHLIKGDIPADMNVYILYLLNLSATVLSYWLFAYMNSLFQAFQRQDVVSKVTLVTNTIQYVFQAGAITILHNYYTYVIILLAGQALTNIVTAIAATKMYPDLKPGDKLDRESVKEINHRICDLFTSRVGAVVVNSADTIVISAFLGLTILAEYQNYYYILTAIIGMVGVIWTSCTAGIGNSLIVETSTAFVGMPWIFYNLFTTLFEKKQFKGYFKRMITYTVMTAVIVTISGIICHFIKFNGTLTTFIVCAVICLTLPNIFYIVAFRKTTEYKESVQLVDEITKHKIPKLKKLMA